MLIAFICVFPFNVKAKSSDVPGHSITAPPVTLSASEVAAALGWVSSHENRCGGYYLEEPFADSKELANTNLIHITSNQGMLFAQHGTSIGQRVTITRFGQQIIANKAYLYRDPVSGKLSTIELSDDVTLREPNSLVIAKSGQFDLKTKGQTLRDILYRTAIYANHGLHFNPTYRPEDLEKARKITQLNAWGRAAEFKQNESQIYEFRDASYSTCPPVAKVWEVKASHIKLNKNIGRGAARNARVYVKGIPIFYTPYLNFPLDNRRQTGFLTPTIGTSSRTGAYLGVPFYWNMAPNYDSTTTPAYLSKRGLQISELFRYLTPTSQGNIAGSVLPNDSAFAELQSSYQAKYQTSTDSYIQAELRRLQNATDTRSAFSWQDETRLNESWSGNIDYNRVSDDYYLIDLNNNLNEVTQNQLLQQAQLNYQSQYWKLIGRVQGYQTLHPLDQTVVQNQYTRLPQLILDGEYPNGYDGFDYFISNEVTHFDITNTPGSNTIAPIGNRLNIQPGISLPLNRPYFYFTPRLQFAFTQYDLQHITPTNPHHPSRALPIFDIHSGLFFDRDIHLFNSAYRQTFEPQVYYTYVPYRNQENIPVFDTTVNTLTYDELFIYNRFSGLDRIGDANQISYGVTSQLIDQQSGYTKLRAGIGQIFYFIDRKVTLCGTDSVIPCTNLPNSPENNFNKSPLSGVLTYHLNPEWSLIGNAIWDVEDNQFNNQSITLHYQTESQKIINLGYSFLRNGDFQQGDIPNNSASNLSQTDLSFAWPISRDWSTIAKWTQNWNRHHFQNLLYGLQYDSCCWAVRFVTGRTFTNLSPNNTYQYNTQFFIQFALKGLGNYGNADPSQLLSNSISGYQTNFGQDYTND